jgi:hypothetical protein
MHLGGRANFLRPYIWSRVSGLMRFRSGSDKGTASHFVIIFGENAKNTITMIKQAFEGESMSRTRKVQTLRDRISRDRRRAKSKACSSFTLTSIGLFTKNSSWQAKQSIANTTVTFYGDCVKTCLDLSQNFGGKGCCIATTHGLSLPFSPGIFDQKQHDCRLYSSLFSRLKMKSKYTYIDPQRHGYTWNNT